MHEPDFQQLQLRLSRPDILVTDLADYEAYCHDATDDTGCPGAIVFAESEHDVVECVRFCASQGLSLVPRGAGTGLSGGCVPSDGSLVLSTERMVRLEIDRERRVAVCGPGVITKTLQDEAARLGLAYPPDPASYDQSTLGGNVAENAGGLRCKRFGVTKDYVIGLRAVTSDGRPLQTGSYTGNRGFNLTDLLLGSEGTLAIITEIMVRLIPAVGRGHTLLVALNSAEQAAQTVADITGAGIIPTVLEYVDGDASAAANAYRRSEGIDRAAAVLLIETTEHDPVAQTETIRAICARNQASYVRVETDQEKAETLWDVRRNVSTALKEMAAVRISEDVAVPNSKFPALVAFVSQLNAESPLRINSYGHAGDGNLHVNFISMTGSEEDRRETEMQIARLMRRTLELGGTLSGEHGIGLAKKRYLDLEFDPVTLRLMQDVKSVFDATGLLNPGKIFEKP